MKNKIVVCDFDGTITKVDSINDFLERFADKSWLDIENDWICGKISTSDAMKMQFGLIKDMTEEKLADFFDSVQIDDDFINFYQKAKIKNVKIVIVSDGFEQFIKQVLSRYGINDIDIFSNRFEFKNGQFVMDFPHKKGSCKRKAGTCKCSFVKEFKKDYQQVFYVGDGVSDFCPANKADVLFAKKSLLKYCQKENIVCTEYSTFKDIINDDRLELNI